jgi:hypothetical protein
MGNIMLTCKEVSELISKRSVLPLTWNEKIKLRMHVGMCKFCRRYEEQMKMIDKFLSDRLRRNDLNPPGHANPELQQRIISELEKH